VGLSGRGPPKPGKLRGVSGRRPVRVGAPRRRRGSAGLPQRVPAPWEPAPFGNRHRPRGHRLPVSPLDLGPAGDLKHVPDRDGFPDFDDACFSLNSVRCEIWEGFVFVNLDSKAESLLDYLSPSPNGSPLPLRGAHPHSQRHDAAGGQLEDHRRRVPRRVPPPGCPPQLLKVLDDVNTTYELLGRHSAMYMPMGVASPRLRDHSEQVVIDELARAGSGFHGKLLRQSEYFMEEGGKASLRDGVPVRQALLEVGRIEGRLRAGTTQG